MRSITVPEELSGAVMGRGADKMRMLIAAHGVSIDRLDGGVLKVRVYAYTPLCNMFRFIDILRRRGCYSNGRAWCQH